MITGGGVTRVGHNESGPHASHVNNDLFDWSPSRLPPLSPFPIESVVNRLSPLLVLTRLARMRRHTVRLKRGAATFDRP